MTARQSALPRRDVLRWASAASAAAILGVRADAEPTEGRAPAAPPGRPNVLWLTAEDMSATLGCWGDTYAHTPNIDKLAAESVRYTNVFVTAPVCSPVRSCLITGVFATSLGTPNLRSAFPVPAEMTGYPSYLRKAGYYCTNNVKTDYNTSRAGAIVKASWDACSAAAHWRGRPKGQPFFAIFNDMVSHQSRTMVFPYAQFKKQVQSKLAPAEIHDPAKAPVPPYYPDTPVVRRTVARFHDCVTVMDKHVGARLKELEDDRLADDTIVFFYSDHGSGLPRHKRTLLDSGMHVPLLIRFPKKYRHLAPARPGQTVDRLISTVDLPPALLSLLGLPVPKYMQGRPFLGKAAVGQRQYVCGARDRVDEAYDLARSVRDKDYLYLRNFMPHLSYNQPSWYSDQGEIRQEITRLAAEGKLAPGPQTHYAGPTRAIEELYDVRKDPMQLTNLAGSPEHQEALKKMRKRLRDWMLETVDLGLLPECDLAERTKGTTPYEWARQAGKYPLAKILAAADLVGRGRKVLPEQTRLLRADDPAVRYWAAVGLHAQGPAAKPAAGALARALSDPAPAVRIEVAAALVALDHEKDKALALLADEMQRPPSDASLRAARALELLGDKALPALPAMRKTLAAVQKGKGDPAMFLRFALDAAVRRLNGRT